MTASMPVSFSASISPVSGFHTTAFAVDRDRPQLEGQHEIRMPVEQDLLSYIALFSGFLSILWLGMLITKLWGSSRYRSDRSE